MLELKDLIAGAALLLAFFNVFWTRYLTARDRNGVEIAKILAVQGAFESEIAQMKMAVNALPTKDSLHALELAVTEVRGSMATMSETIKPIARSVQRIDEFLMSTKPQRTGR